MLLVHAGALAVFWVEVNSTAWVALLVMVYFRGFLTTAGLHRYFSHRSFKTSRGVQFVLAVLCCTNFQQGPLWWAVYHRHHHRCSDTAGDPHSPHHGGFWWAYCGWLFVPLDPDWRTVSDLCRYPELVWLERFWQVPGLLVAGLCWWAGGWGLLCAACCLSAVVAFQGAFVVNTLAHLVGSRRYDTPDRSRNSLLLAMVTMGDGWHNNHHHYPHAAHAGFRWWEVDTAFRVIRLMEMLGLIWNVRRVPPEKMQVVGTASTPTCSLR
jgi:stearoyl-CoA desaturase (delta-9 desaturase)